MKNFKFRVQIESEYYTVYRDIQILTEQSLYELHLAILDAYDFDHLYQAELFTSDEMWRTYQRFISDDFEPKVPLFNNTLLNQLIAIPYQRLRYHYDPNKMWVFFITLIEIGTANPQKTYPLCCFKHGIAPAQYTPTEIAQIKSLKSAKDILKIKAAIR